MHTRLPCAVIAAVLCLASPAHAQSDDRIDLSGVYPIETGGTEGSEYTGTLEFKRRKTVTLPTAGKVDLWQLTWHLTLHRGTQYEMRGIGIMLGNTVFAAYGGKSSNYNLWILAPLGLSKSQQDAMVARHAQALQRAERKVRNWGWVEDRSVFGELKPEDNYIAYGIGSDFDVEMSTGAGSLSPVSGDYTDHGVWLKDNGERTSDQMYRGRMHVKREGQTLTINWSGTAMGGHYRDYDIDGTGLEFGEGLLAAIQGGAYGKDTNAGIMIYEVTNGKLVGRYADNGETTDVLPEIVIVPDEVAARSPALFKH